MHLPQYITTPKRTEAQQGINSTSGSSTSVNMNLRHLCRSKSIKITIAINNIHGAVCEHLLRSTRRQRGERHATSSRTSSSQHGSLLTPTSLLSRTSTTASRKEKAKARKRREEGQRKARANNNTSNNDN